jgi:hypothetical protein
MCREQYVGSDVQGSEFTRTLAACAKAGDFTSISSLLREMTPAAVDAELRSMEVWSQLYVPHAQLIL